MKLDIDDKCNDKKGANKQERRQRVESKTFYNPRPLFKEQPSESAEVPLLVR
jgi:hypothetical protein